MIVLGFATIIALLAASVIAPAAGQQHPVAELGGRIVVNFAKPRHTNGSMLGFLHGMNRTAPEARWIAPLRPAIWRGTFHNAPYERAVLFGARYVLVVSDLWGYPGRHWRRHKPPWRDLAAWFAFVRRLALANRHRSLVWDIWNEPDDPFFWNGTIGEYYLTFAVAERAIRSVLGSRAVVSGPSVSGFRWSWLKGLLQYCRAHKCRVDALSWHELRAGEIQNISKHIEAARHGLLADPALSSTRVRLIHVNEYRASSDALYPGELIAYLDELELGGAHGAALACWPDPMGGSACYQHTLDGLLDPETMRPRTTWWAARAYADGANSRVSSGSTLPALAVLAASHAPDAQHAEVLIGYFDTRTPLPATIAASVSVHHLNALAFLRGAHTVHVSIDFLPGIKSDPVPPSRPTTRNVAISNGAAEILLPMIPMHCAVVIRLSPVNR